ncbi:MAG: hypothetical protein EXS59_00455 [Candidatus Taylorbacteria bacterium]|nr:hypothetical protein [Candidatus Taylorbacteria bacterium]
MQTFLVLLISIVFSGLIILAILIFGLRFVLGMVTKEKSVDAKVNQKPALCPACNEPDIIGDRDLGVIPRNVHLEMYDCKTWIYKRMSHKPCGIFVVLCKNLVLLK